jgi:hypothetical protein
MPISIVRAKALCNATELALVASSAPRAISKLSASKLRFSVEQARKLRDKWRDQSDAQRRKSQKKLGARGTDDNARSIEKAQLFDEVLGRFAARLAASDSAGTVSKPRAGAKRTERNRSHRATRANVRGSLQEAKRGLASPAKKKPAKANVTDKKDEASPKTAPAAPVSATAATTGKPVASRSKPRVSRKPAATGISAIEAGRTTQGLRVTNQQQLLAKTSAKQGRLKAAGFVRIQKNRSAANKRSQARRDSR